MQLDDNAKPFWVQSVEEAIRHLRTDQLIKKWPLLIKANRIKLLGPSRARGMRADNDVVFTIR